MSLNLGTGATWTGWTRPEVKVFQQIFADASQWRYVLVGVLHRTACQTSAGNPRGELHITDWFGCPFFASERVGTCGSTLGCGLHQHVPLRVQ